MSTRDRSTDATQATGGHCTSCTTGTRLRSVPPLKWISAFLFLCVFARCIPLFRTKFMHRVQLVGCSERVTVVADVCIAGDDFPHSNPAVQHVCNVQWVRNRESAISLPCAHSSSVYVASTSLSPSLPPPRLPLLSFLFLPRKAPFFLYSISTFCASVDTNTTLTV